MVNPITVQMIRDTAAIIGVIVALGYYIINIQNQRETRQAQLFMQLYQHYRTKEWWKDGWELLQYEWTDFEDFTAKYDSSVNLDNFTQRYSFWSYWDGMGILLKKGLIDRDMLYYLQGGYGAIWNWEKYKDVIYESRRVMNEPDHFLMYEYLVDELKKMKYSRGQTVDIPEHWGDFRKQ
jgi:hypothetical protein